MDARQEDIPVIAYKEAYSIEDFAALFSIGRTSVFKLMKAGEIRSSRVLSRTLIPRSEVERFAALLRENAA